MFLHHHHWLLVKLLACELLAYLIVAWMPLTPMLLFCCYGDVYWWVYSDTVALVGGYSADLLWTNESVWQEDIYDLSNFL